MATNAETPKPGAQDPAMDDILASIRRILNEDETPPGAGAAPEADSGPAPGPAPAGAEPLDLTESMLVQHDNGPSRAEPPPAAVSPPAAPVTANEPAGEPERPPGLGAEALVAPAVAAATAGAMGKLLRAVVQERAATVSRGGPSIEDVVREELRPLLKEWLDQHLPPIVERLVRAEIERVVGRAL